MERTIPRIVITGLGAVTPIGNDVPAFWDGLRNGRNGIGHVSLVEREGLPVQIAGEVKDFEAERYLDRKAVRRSGRFVQFATAAAMQALEDSGYSLDGDNGDEVGVVMASSGDAFNMGEPWSVLEKRGASRVDPLLITRHGQHMAAARVARELGLRGPNTTINTACASGTDALGHALNLLRLGHARALLAGGAEAMVTQLALASMGRLGALSQNNDDPEHASRPFDLNRDGFVLGEGAGVLMLEREDDARERGARMYGELAGVGWSFDAADDAAPDAEGESLAIKRAMRDAAIEPGDLDYINAHGTSTQLNDRTETAALKLALGEDAYRVAISSSKSMTGHLAAGAGGIEAVATVLAMHNECLPPTINHVTPDPDCDLDIVPNEARAASPQIALSNSFGLGGQNASAIFRRHE
ncbi:MAG: beta-ketoacyl-ACP synthase II [Dehalococcoidia bacterium]|nr:beta-ketoacyl-ACP synthase II [Dehalococcoidia bacterium]